MPNEKFKLKTMIKSFTAVVTMWETERGQGRTERFHWQVTQRAWKLSLVSLRCLGVSACPIAAAKRKTWVSFHSQCGARGTKWPRARTKHYCLQLQLEAKIYPSKKSESSAEGTHEVLYDLTTHSSLVCWRLLVPCRVGPNPDTQYESKDSEQWIATDTT